MLAWKMKNAFFNLKNFSQVILNELLTLVNVNFWIAQKLIFIYLKRIFETNSIRYVISRCNRDFPINHKWCNEKVQRIT